MNSYNSALNKLKRNNISIKNEIVSIKKLLSRVVAKDVISPSNYPLCDNTSLDGYALNSKETNSRKSLLELITLHVSCFINNSCLFECSFTVVT